jgi:hypothetical protein
MPRREDQRSRAQNGVFEKGVGAPFARARQSAEAIASARAARHDRSSSLGTVGGESSRRRPANRPRNRDKRHEPLIETCKLNGVEPLTYMADVITKIVNGHLASKLDELMRGLIAYEGGDATVWRTVTLPTAEEEDCKRQHRERRVLIQERGRHVNRISRRRSNTHSIERA